MIVEISRAADFLVHLLRIQCNKISEAQLALFKFSLSNLLTLHYREHWFPEHPNKGSGYRCIRINGNLDPIIVQAGIAVGLHVKSLRNSFPHELTMWIDPKEVSYRIGDNGSICILYENRKIDEIEKPLLPKQTPKLYHDPRQCKDMETTWVF